MFAVVMHAFQNDSLYIIVLVPLPRNALQSVKGIPSVRFRCRPMSNPSSKARLAADFADAPLTKREALVVIP